jgi:ribose 5-phosphate isomerase B
MKIHIATDHAGFALKEAVMAYLVEQNNDVVDHGAFLFKEDDDYPDFIKKASLAVSENPTDSIGIIFGGSGQGESIVANKYPHVRCALWYGGSYDIITLAREHNNANILSLGGRFISQEECIRAVQLFLDTPFSDEERHSRRINAIENI